MLEILYRPTNEVGLFMVKGEFTLIIFCAITFGAVLGYFARLNNTVRKSEGDGKK